MEDGAIDQNETSVQGGGVYVDLDGAFTMNGGSIESNQAKSETGAGGGVYVGGTFTLTGGKIWKNRAHQGGGVSVYPTATVQLSGDPVIDGSSEGGNLYLESEGEASAVINVIRKLTGEEPVHVSMAKPGEFTSGLKGNGTMYSFVSDDDTYLVRINDNDEAELATADWEVIFESSGGSLVHYQKLHNGDKAVEPEEPTKEGWGFISWQLDGVDYDFNTPVTEDITLTALWGNTDWKDLQAQINDAEDGATIVLEKDVVAWPKNTALVIPEGKNITIDLNDHIISRDRVYIISKMKSSVWTFCSGHDNCIFVEEPAATDNP